MPSAALHHALVPSEELTEISDFAHRKVFSSTFGRGRTMLLLARATLGTDIQCMTSCLSTYGTCQMKSSWFLPF